MPRRAPPPTILVDNNEQRPWGFRSRRVVEAHGELPLVVRSLETGDYSVLGLTSVITIERKSLADFINSVTNDRERFWRELVRMRALQHRCVIVEASLETVACGAYRSQAPPQSVIRSASAIMYDHGIPVIWAGDRDGAEREAAWWLVRAWRDHRAALGAEEG